MDLTRDEAIGLGALGGVAGLGLLLSQLGKSAPATGCTGPITLPGGGVLGCPDVATADQAGALQLSISQGTMLILVRPQITFTGPPTNIYSHARIVQNGVTVYGSGIGPEAVGVSGPSQIDATHYLMVSPNEVQPEGGRAPDLHLYPWPGPPGCGPGSHLVCICGGRAQPGSADLYLEVYGDSGETGRANDGVDGLQSPTCAGRTPFQRQIWRGKINFVA